MSSDNLDVLVGIATHTYQLYIKKNSNKINLRQLYRSQEKNLYGKLRAQDLKITFSEYSEYLRKETKELVSIVSCNPR